MTDKINWPTEAEVRAAFPSPPGFTLMMRVSDHEAEIARLTAERDAAQADAEDWARKCAAADEMLDAAKTARQADLAKANQLLVASKELAEYASYAEIVGGISVNRAQIRNWCDAVFDVLRALPKDENFEPTFLRADMAAKIGGA